MPTPSESDCLRPTHCIFFALWGSETDRLLPAQAESGCLKNSGAATTTDTQINPGRPTPICPAPSLVLAAGDDPDRRPRRSEAHQGGGGGVPYGRWAPFPHRRSFDLPSDLWVFLPTPSPYPSQSMVGSPNNQSGGLGVGLPI